MITPSCSGASSEGGRFGLATHLGILAIEAYQALLAPLVGGYCRYVPSCSLYAREALERHGLLRGGWLALRRVSRCHPFHPGGIDPVT